MKPFYFDLDNVSLPRGNHLIGSVNPKSITNTFFQELFTSWELTSCTDPLSQPITALFANMTAAYTRIQLEFKNKTYHSNNCLEHQKSVKKLCNKYLYFTAPENSAQDTRYREPRQQLILAGLYCQGACSVTVVCIHEQVLLWTYGSGSHIKSKN